jgi:hypothetical protein
MVNEFKSMTNNRFALITTGGDKLTTSNAKLAARA